ncbi:MAG: YceI family protein [Balneolaceae bacterium]
MRKLAVILAMIFSTSAIYAQNYSITPEESKISVKGTSNVHDWELNAEEYSGEASITIEDNQLLSIEALKFSVIVNSMKSGKGGLDKKTYGALKENKHSTIDFELTQVNQINDNSVMATGDLTIAGVTNSIEMEVTFGILPDGAISFQGSKQLKMTDYNVSPPSAMFGAVKAADEIEVNFDITFACSSCSDQVSNSGRSR